MRTVCALSSRCRGRIGDRSYGTRGLGKSTPPGFANRLAVSCSTRARRGPVQERLILVWPVTSRAKWPKSRSAPLLQLRRLSRVSADLRWCSRAKGRHSISRSSQRGTKKTEARCAWSAICSVSVPIQGNLAVSRRLDPSKAMFNGQ
jgi:hypothetical protein